jgi:hypothetical protein
MALSARGVHDRDSDVGLQATPSAPLVADRGQEQRGGRPGLLPARRQPRCLPDVSHPDTIRYAAPEYEQGVTRLVNQSLRKEE